MINILAIGDIHWGVIDAKTMYLHLQAVFKFIEKMDTMIDMIVICGDYFDYRLSLNSKAANLSIKWMNELLMLAYQYRVKAVRVIKGTEEHDNNQLEVFRSLEDEKAYPCGFFRIFTQNTVEETLPGLKCMYCPDENINWKDYEKKYMDNLLSGADIGFFHGSFDIVLPDIVVQESEETSAKSVVFPFNTLASLIKGPLISAHWHDPFDEEPLHYLGSFETWAFGEQKEKGFALISYEPEDSSYLYQRVMNPLVAEYKTIRVDTRVMETGEEYNELIDAVIDMQKDALGLNIRVVFTISDDNPKNMDYISAFRHAFINNRAVKVVVKDLLKKAKKEQRKKAVAADSEKYGFISDKNIPIAQKFQEFILLKTKKELPIDRINHYISKYLGE